jgi:interferon gamma-inducible protein 30
MPNPVYILTINFLFNILIKGPSILYGNAHESKNPDGTWKFECQHGEPECVGNILEVCIMQQLNWAVNMYLPVISCMEGADGPGSSAEGCVSALSSVSYGAVKKFASVSTPVH